MKVTDLRRKLMVALAAGGLLAPGALHAADFNTNIVVNGTFENVDLNTTAPAVNAVKILDWDDGSKIGFAYSHDGQTNGVGLIPDYANGGPLANGGHFYFTPNATAGDVHVATQVTQLIDITSGPSGGVVNTGALSYDLKAFFSSYANDGDYGVVYAEFLNSANVHIGAAQIDNDNDTATWTQKTSSGSIPIGTTTIRLSILGVRETGGGPDGYIDNVELELDASAPELIAIVDRYTGNISLVNLTGSLENISGYSITSVYGALKPASWLSIADNYDSGNVGPNQVDSAHAWSELTKPISRGDLSEADLASGLGASLANLRTVDLGNAWIATPTEDLVFQYVSNGQVINGIVGYSNNGGLRLSVGDLNSNGTINSSDWMIFNANQSVDLTGKSLAEAYRLGDLNGDFKNNHADFVIFKEAFDATNGFGSFVAMVNSIPEPSTTLLVLVGGLFAMPMMRRPAWRK